MHRRKISRLSMVLILFAVQLLLSIKIAASQTMHSYYPVEYNLLNATAYFSGTLTDLQSDDDLYMTFRSYASQTTAQTLYAHQEITLINSTSYSGLKLESADGSGTSLSASMSSNGRQLWGKFVYSLQGITSIPANTWTVYYRTWHSSVPESGVLTNSPSSIPTGTWINPYYASSSDNNYTYTSTDGAMQQYGNYGFNIPPTANITKVEIGYEAYTDNNERIGITLSWDGGTTWAKEYLSPPLETVDQDGCIWVDFTTATNWTVDKLSDANFRARAKCAILGTPDNVYLDWIPVRVTYIADPPSAHADVDILIRKSDGSIREIIATDVANSANLTTVAQTLSGTYSWPTYTVVNETDCLEIDYYLDVTTVSYELTAYLRIDDITLAMVDQTRVSNIVLPSEYTLEVEFTGSSNTDSWSQLAWTIDSAWTIDNVSVTLQLYNYTLGAYSTSGDGYIAYTSSTPLDTSEKKSQIVTVNPTNFRNALGNWKMKIKGVKSTTSQFDFKANLIKYEVTSVAIPNIVILNVAWSPTSVYPGEIITINVTVKNEGGAAETFNVTTYYNNTQIEKQTVSNLAPETNTTLTFSWNTTEILPGTYTIKAIADTVSNETETADNTYIDGYVEVKAIHDVSVISVTPSVTQVYVGQVVNVTIVIRNKGTVTEAFNVTIYYDNMQIEKQLVSSLAPDTSMTLTFKWNTTGVPPNTYTIKAVADEVVGEFNTSDNIFSGRTIEISVSDFSNSAPSIPPYIFPIGIVAIGIILGVIWKKKGAGSKIAGFEFFNEMLGGGIPVGSSVLIIGGPASGKSMLCQQLAHEYLTERKACIFISYDEFPNKIRENMKNFGWDLSKCKQKAFIFIDCYSSIAGMASQERHSVQQPFALTELSIATSTVLEEITDTPKAMFLDSATTLFTNLDPSRVIGFLQDRGAKIKAENGIFIFTVGKGTVAPNFINRLEEIVDCIIELEVYEEQGKNLRRMRVKKLRGQRHFDGWITFKIEQNHGLVFLRPKKAK